MTVVGLHSILHEHSAADEHKEVDVQIAAIDHLRKERLPKRTTYQTHLIVNLHRMILRVGDALEVARHLASGYLDSEVEFGRERRMSPQKISEQKGE